jgi:hypothetical protein
VERIGATGTVHEIDEDWLDAIIESAHPSVIAGRTNAFLFKRINRIIVRCGLAASLPRRRKCWMGVRRALMYLRSHLAKTRSPESGSDVGPHTKQLVIQMVAPVRVELTHPCEYRNLNPARLPIPPRGHYKNHYSLPAND